MCFLKILKDNWKCLRPLIRMEMSIIKILLLEIEYMLVMVKIITVV